MKYSTFTLLYIAMMLPLVSATADDWGNLKIRFMLDGPVPEVVERKIDKDPKICGESDVDRTWIVSAEGEVKDVVMVLMSKDQVPVHPDYDASQADEVVMEARKCQFVPRIVFARVGQSLKVANKDSVGHNANILFFANTATNQLFAAKASTEPSLLKRPEPHAVSVVCGIYPWMQGFVFVQEHPYMAASNAAGVVEMKKVPIGTHTFKICHDGKWLRTIKNDRGEDVKSAKSDRAFEIKPGENDLGTFKLMMAKK